MVRDDIRAEGTVEIRSRLRGDVGAFALFVLADLMEIGGGYLVWLWLREERAVVLGVIGGFLCSSTA